MTSRARTDALARYRENREAINAKLRAKRRAQPETVRAAERQKAAAYRALHRERYREYGFKRKHGVTRSERDHMLAEQGGRCAICGTSSFGKRGPQLDHDHRTGKLRRVLCVTCNVGLGAFDDNTTTLACAAVYLDPELPRVDEHW